VVAARVLDDPAAGGRRGRPVSGGRAIAGIALLVLVLVLAFACVLVFGRDAPDARAATSRATKSSTARFQPARSRPGTNTGAKRAGAGSARTAPAAPVSPPLSSSPVAGGEQEVSAPSGAEDPLVSNGLGSPLCRAGAGEGGLSQASASDCRTSGFEAAPAPTGNYGFDVHINTGVANATAYFMAAVQDMLQLLWTVLVALVHGLIVTFEWCYTIDLLRDGAMSGVAQALHTMQATVTRPWLALVLALASVLSLYHGLVRRRVAETVGQALTMLAMMVGGLWVIANPAGTVGALGEISNQAGLGTLGAVAAGTPTDPDRTLADSMRALFAGAIEGPWCFIEFGSVGWCEDPPDLDRRLYAAGLKIAATEQARIGCHTTLETIESGGGLGPCAPPGSAQARALRSSAELLRGARTNGELFLALPANGPLRNSINDSGMLFNVLCGGDEEPCEGPTAAQAEFRTQGATWWRCMGLFFVWLGLLGMILTLGFVALHLLGAALTALLYLLLAPAAVLAPALGDGGRDAFRKWAMRLLGAVVSKTIFSFLLGVLLLMERVLTVDLTALGWFTQWLLVSSMWWGAYRQRHRVLGQLQGTPGRIHEPRSLARRVSGALETPRAIARGGGRVKDRLRKPATNVEKREQRAQASRERAEKEMEEQVQHTLEREHSDARATVEEAPETQTRISAKRAQLERIAREQAEAQAGGNRRRTIELEHRARRVGGEIEDEQERLNTAREVVDESKRAYKATGKVYTRAQAEERAGFLDDQAALPRAGARAESGERRDYAPMAGIAGYGRKEYEELDAPSQRAARLKIDRELALRKELGAVAQDLDADDEVSLGRRERRAVDEHFDRTLEQRMRDGGHTMPASRSKPSSFDAWQQEGRAARRAAGAHTRAGEGESSVMRDAREVAARRKRQLGRDRR
jgi:hypothetical protein